MQTQKTVTGQTYTVAPNPHIQENGLWSESYPPITDDCLYLRNKYTGEIVPNTPDHARRSDILEPFYGDPANPDDPYRAVKQRGKAKVADTQTMDSL